MTAFMSGKTLSLHLNHSEKYVLHPKCIAWHATVEKGLWTRRLQQRMKEHQDDYKGGDKKVWAVAEHTWQ